MPFLSDGSRCVTRSGYSDAVSNGVESILGFFNGWLKPSEPGASLLNQFSYFYDDEVVLRLTRFELGLWLAFAMCFLLRKVLDSDRCGRRKTVFDFMRPAAAGAQVHKVTEEDVKRIRAEALARKRQ